MRSRMSIADSIVKHGTEAVLEYRRMTGSEHDNHVPEVFLHHGIARGVHRDLGYHAHVERSYEEIAVELGRSRGAELTGIHGLQRADVALYEGRSPIAVIEIKKYAEAGSDARIRSDLAKMRLLATGTALQVYVAVLITDTSRTLGIVRAKALGEALGGAFDVIGPTQVANDGNADWSWHIACGAFA